MPPKNEHSQQLFSSLLEIDRSISIDQYSCRDLQCFQTYLGDDLGDENTPFYRPLG